MDNPKVTKKGDQVIMSYVDEKTGKIAVYEVGIKLEVSDFSGQWFPAKIVEVDKGEKEVLVHFENWSTRFDEWIKMDSNRLRPSLNTNIVKTQFKVGEQVEALWNTDGQKYSGVIQNILPNDYYQVMFDDGIKLKKKYNQIFKLKPVTRNISRSGGPGGGCSKLKVSGPNPSLPELTPISQLVSAAESQSQLHGNKLILQPPPLHPKPVPNSLRETEVITESPQLSFQPVKPSRSRKKISPSPPEPLPAEIPLSPPVSNYDEPLSAKRKRTVRDYSEMLKIRRRFSYSRDVERKPRGPLRSRGHLYLEPPNLDPPKLFPENAIPPSELPVDDELDDSLVPEPEPEPESKLLNSEKVLITEIKQPPPLPISPTPPQEIMVSPPVSVLPQYIETEVSPPSTNPVSIPVPPVIKPKPKAKRRIKLTMKSRKPKTTKRPIRFVVVDEEEFHKDRTPRKSLTKATAIEKPSEMTTSEVQGTAEATMEIPNIEDIKIEKGLEIQSTSDNIMDLDIQQAVSTVPENMEPRIIKRRRRRTNVHPPSVEVSPTVSNDEPLSKRKRTIHDYSMLLKIRPKFFFDIDEEQKRPNTLTGTKKRKLCEDGSIDSGCISTDAVAISSSGALMLSSPTDLLTESEIKHEYDQKVSDTVEITKKSELSVVADMGPTSIATHRPIRRSSSQFARKAHMCTDDTTAFLSRNSEGGLKSNNVSIIIQPLEGDYKGKLDTVNRSLRRSPSRHIVQRNITGEVRDVKKEEKLGNSVISSKSLEIKQEKVLLGSKLNQLDFNTSFEDDEELLDINYSSVPIPSTSPKIPQIKVKSPTIVQKGSNILTPPAKTPLSPVARGKERSKKRSRFANRTGRSNRWWTKKTSHSSRKKVSVDGESKSVPRSKKSIKPKIARRRPGDLLSGLTPRRIKTIKNNLYGQGFKKKILAIPAVRDVSVDIISCVCGSTDEHGLMVQCEYCQCWQHGQCFDIETVNDMPKNYVCEACLVPENVRAKMVTDFPYHFHRVGKLPRFAFGPNMKPKSWKLLQDSNFLMERLYQVREIINTSRVHLNIMEAKPDHMKLYQWDKPHATIQETNQERRFNKVYRPLLRRLLYFNRDDPSYVEKLRVKVESTVKRRNQKERQEADEKLNKKLGIFIPQIPIPVIEKQETLTPKLHLPPPLPILSKEAVRQEKEARRIRKELESLNNKPKVEPSVGKILSTLSNNSTVVKTKSSSNDQVLKSISSTQASKFLSDESTIESIMSSMLSKLEQVTSVSVSETQVQDRPSVIQQVPTTFPIETSIKPLNSVNICEKSTEEKVKSEQNLTLEEPLNTTLEPIEKGLPESSLGIITIQQSEDSTENTPQIKYEFEVVLKNSIVAEVSESKEELKMDDLQNMMELDPSDPKFNTMAEDLVKSCCEEPESLIKTLEDLAKDGVEETVGDLEGTDSDLLNFLDDAFMDSFGPSGLSSISNFVEPKLPPPPPYIPNNTSTFPFPSQGPIMLTRLTPELCRGNLVLTILDQQRIIDQHLDEIEVKVIELEKMKASGVGGVTRAKAIRRISILHNKFQKMMKEFEIVKSIGKKATHGLRELIRLDPNRLDAESPSEPEEGPENEETDSVEDEEDEDDVSDDDFDDD